MLKTLYNYLISLPVFFFLDIVWIQFVANRLYNKYISDILITDPRTLPTLLFYLIHVAVLTIVISISPALPLWKKFVIAFLIGLTAYATFSLTNYAILASWSKSLILPDILWGSFLSGFSILIAQYITNIKNV
ncbi:DUF2177 family protein [Candidatus Dojkabacteria bacterium]|nr:DUF2177 family protein [Candidatus Dojkabacteria bacterium]